MNIVINIYKHWADMILNHKKQFEFRNNIGKNVNVGDKVFIYEAKSHNGCGMLVGDFTIKSIVEIGEGFIEKYFLEYYVRNILKDDENANKIRDNIKYELSNYKSGANMEFLLSDICMKSIKKDQYPSLDDIINDPMVEKGRKIVMNASTWLLTIGAVNFGYDTCYKFAFEVSDINKYNIPISIINLKDINGNNLKKAPRSWQYIL